MPSSDRARSERAPAARFTNVTQGKLRRPSWMSAARSTPLVEPEPASLKPPPIPAEALQELRSEAAPPRSVQENIDSRPSRRPQPPTPHPSEFPPPVEIPKAPSIAPPSAVAIRALVDGFHDALSALAQARRSMLDGTAREIVELATTIARRVIAHELSLDPALVEGLAREGIEALGQRDRVTVRLGSRFAEAGALLERRLQMSGMQVDIVLDGDLGDYGCIVETDLGRVDESVESRLAQLLEAIETDSRPPGS